MFNLRRFSINRTVEKIAELGVPALVLIVAIERIGPFFQSRLLNRFAALAGPFGTFAGFVVSAIYKFGSEVLFNSVVEDLKKQGKTQEQILAEIKSAPIPEWLRERVIGYIEENVDFETIETADLSNRNEEFFSIIQQSIADDFEHLEQNINAKIDTLETKLVEIESRHNDRINALETELKQFIGRAVAVGVVATTGIVAVLVFIF